ncbi:vitamin B12 ABC transporter substrate-binding protein BtuF [Biostraticola tofi]|uniref:Vitamin B12-binding protein n=1 Tax=Biostraticola tofi TaxID=466109 RepID=A0A4V2W5C5_9GAMM|nr:vitamin B12 ABC transporter substrate-binding protein BtuF [Biostraticola tofi]TCV99204.1 vitamin B12 transport system substrate-binding protein [Biostraticola tofi]
MRRVSRLLLALGLLAAALPTLAAHRVISLAPHTTELAYAAGMGDVLVAVSAWSDYPPPARQLEQVASWQGVNIERIMALKPDLILAWRGGNPQRAMEQLAAFSIPVVYIDPGSIADIARALDNLARYSPHPEQAHQAARQLLKGEAELKQRYAGLRHRRVFMQFGTQPLFTAAGDTLQSRVLSLCGATNVFSHSPVPWPQVGREQVLLRKPEAIVTIGNQDRSEAIRQFWAPHLKVPVITIKEDWFSRAGPRMLDGAEQLCQGMAALDGSTLDAKKTEE